MRKLAILATVTLSGMLAVAATPALAATTPLVVSQSTAFAALGHWCGGINERAYATGFDAASGYPTGDVYLSTTCSSGGRGSRPSTFTAWIGVVWDFTGAVASYQSLSAAPAVNPTFSATDAHGNQIYNQTNRAYLVLAAGFVPAPRLTSISVTSGPAAGGTSVMITGTGFTGATAVKFGGTPAGFTVNGDTSLAAVSPAAGAGTVDVTVTTTGGTSATSANDQFTFVAAPSVSSISPNSGPILGGTRVTITGSGFLAASGVAFGGIGTWFTVNSDASITATAPTGEDLETVNVTVTTLGGTSATSVSDQFTYSPSVPPPSVTGVAPRSGPVGGGRKVTITGSGFTDASGVSFGDTAAGFSLNSDTSITAVAPAGMEPGAVDVTVTTPGGSSATHTADQFTYTPPPPKPAVKGLSPRSGPVTGGRRVTITGFGFTGATAVHFGGSAAVIVKLNSDRSIVVLAPAHRSGIVNVTITTIAGASAVSVADRFTYAKHRTRRPRR